MARMINRMIGWLGLALVGLACGRPLAHPCRNGVECAVGWSCVDQLCQPDSPRDGAADQMSAADHSNHDDAHDAKQDQADKGDSTTLDGTPDAPADLAGDRISDRPDG